MTSQQEKIPSLSTVTCPLCRGSGMIIAERCPKCMGTGKIMEIEK